MIVLLAAAMTLLAQSVAVTAPPSAARVTTETRPDVVVTGRRLDDTARALAACIARHCPPDQEIAASLAHAENQFVAGDYRLARGTLLKTAGRNRRYAHDYPVPVSDLMRANSRVAAHLGETRDYRIDTIDTLDALRAGLADTDPRVLAQRIEVGDMFASVGLGERAESFYRKVEVQARDLGLASLEGTARLRVIVLTLREGGDDLRAHNGDMRAALRDLDMLAASADPKLANFATVARVIRAQYQAKHGDDSALNALIAELRARGTGARPVLVYAPAANIGRRPDQVTTHDEAPTYNTISRLPVGSFDKQWIDVTYWVRPDGSVGEVSVIRSSAADVDAWDKPVLQAIGKRRYLPLSLPTDDPGVLRVERYTYTSSFDDSVTGTRIRTRDGQPRIEMLDMTQEASTAPRRPAGS